MALHRRWLTSTEHSAQPPHITRKTFNTRITTQIHHQFLVRVGHQSHDHTIDSDTTC
ncbi:pilus assembly protein CpaF [Sesbania bispinosa]|nr:pilus assembly protein CpaF [Sesbania bispinosa]